MTNFLLARKIKRIRNKNKIVKLKCAKDAFPISKKDKTKQYLIKTNNIYKLTKIKLFSTQPKLIS